MNDSTIRSVTQTSSGEVDHVEHIHSRYLHEQQLEVDRNQRHPKFNPQPPGNIDIKPGKHVKVKPKGPKEPDQQKLIEAINNDLNQRNIKNK